MATTEQIIDAARELGKKIGAHEAAIKLESIAKKLEADVEAQRVLNDHNRHLQTLAEKEQAGTPIEVEDGAGTPNVVFIPVSDCKPLPCSPNATVCTTKEQTASCAGDATLNHSSANHEPPYIGKYFIIRCDNSTTGSC